MIEAPKSKGICKECGKSKKGRIYHSIRHKGYILVCKKCMKERNHA